MQRQALVGVEHEGGAVENQLVLAADLIEIGERQARIDDPRHRDIQPVIAFDRIERRTVGHQQQFGAGFAQTFDRIETPNVFADRHADAHAANVEGTGHGAGLEDAFLVEDAVIGQIDFERRGLHRAGIEIRHRVVEAALLEPGRADQNRRTAIGGVLGKGFDRFHRVLLEHRLQHEVFRRIAGDIELAEKDEVGAGSVRLRPRRAGAREVAGKIAHDRIELGQRDGETIGHAEGFSAIREFAEGRLRERGIQSARGRALAGWPGAGAAARPGAGPSAKG